MLTNMTPHLTDFRHLRPSYEYSQDAILSWLAGAHARAEAMRQSNSPHFDTQLFERQIHTLLRRLGSGPGKIKTRGSEIAGIGHSPWEEKALFSISEKTAFFGKAVDQFFEDFYPEDESLPHELIHVTCTGYLSPSGAQKIVSSRNAGRSTTVTHAYHMGCYASIPALRIAKGLVGSNGKRADIVHTELCSLHLDPYSHTPEQLVIQSLFADGCIRYSLSQRPSSPSLVLLALRETTLQDTCDAMTWQPASWGMQMSLKKEVPQLIANSIEQALDDLAGETDLTRDYLQKQAVFAIHPGGPKIIETVASLLKLRPGQYQHSCAVLEKYGNMSSATLPHIWEMLLSDPAIPHGSPIVSLAFGPGLTVASSLMNKEHP